MSSIPNYLMKKNNILGIKPLKKSIPININSNPTPGKFIFSNHVNKIASSYLSMGRKIQINKNIKASKTIHVNTNSATNYYTLNSKETKQTNSSITNSMLNNIKNNNNKSEINSNNYNNFININNINNHSLQQAIDFNRINYINIKDKKHLSTLSNSRLSNDLLINGYQSSKNNLNNIIFKNKLNGTNNAINNLSKNKPTLSTRHNLLDSKNKTKKIQMKSKMRQFKFQNKNNRPTSTSLNNVYVTKRHFHRDLFSYIKSDLLNLNNDKNLLLSKIKSNYYLASDNQNNNEIRNRHNRNNTASFGNKEIINIFHKKTLSFKNNNLNLNESNNTNKIKNSISKKSKEFNIEIGNNAINNRVEGSNNSRKKLIKLNNGKKIDVKISIHENKGINLKDNKINSNNNKTKKIHNFYYNKYLTNNHNSNILNNNSNIIHQIKNYNSNNINGIKKIMVKQKPKNKFNSNKNNKINNKPIPTPCQKIKSNLIPSQRNIKINLAKFLKGVKNKPINKGKAILNRKSFSIKKITKENNSDFSLSQLNDILAKKFKKNNNEEETKIGNNIINSKENLIKEIKNNENEKTDNKIIINTNFISNVKVNDKEPNNKIKINNYINNKYSFNLNSYSNNSTNNNNFLKNKNDYSIDNIPENLGVNTKNRLVHKKIISNKEVIQNISDLNLDSDVIPKTEENFEKGKEINKIDINLDEDKNNENNNEKIIKEEQMEDNEQLNNKLINKEIKNNLFDEENLEDLPEDYDENFDDLYSIINKIKFGNVLVCVEGLFTPEGKTYLKYKDTFDKFYDKLYNKKKNSFSNSNYKQKRIIEVASNAKTTSSSSKKNIVSPNIIYNNDLNIVGLNVNY